MDTSETYIKMSEQAMKHLPACQAPYDDGEWVTYRHDRFLPEAIKNTVRVGDYLEPERCYWETWVLCGTDGVIHLLQQDQLQEMMDRPWYALMDGIKEWFLFTRQDKGAIGSMEQLWLAFLMAFKYGKRWDGGDWI